MRNLKLRFALLLIAISAATAICNAKDNDPRWINASEKRLNAGVDNNTYSIHLLRSHSPNDKQLGQERRRALTKYAVSDLGAIETSVRVDSVSGGPQPVFWVYYNTPDNENNFIAAKLIDQYSKFTDEIFNVYEYEFYYLFAISAVNTYPQYDEFINYRPSNTTALAMSVIPGLGQFYKGHNIKGGLILGGELVFAAAAVVFEKKRIECKNEVGKFDEVSAPALWESWHSKSRTWGTWRNGAIGCCAAIYIYNLIDAARSPGRGNFKVEKLMRKHLVLSPYIDPDFTGFSMRVTF